MKDGPPTRDSLWFKYLLSASAASVAEAAGKFHFEATYPLDITKTRLQIQGEAGHGSTVVSTPYRGTLRTAYGIATEEGIRKLWQGVVPAIYRHVVYTGCRMVIYEWIRDNVLGKQEDGTFPVWKAILGGMFAGGLGQFIASPTDLVKVQMQMEGRRRLEGKPPRVKSTWHAFRNILAENGVRGLWKGWVPNVQRAALVNLGDLATYDTAKRRILKYTDLKDNHITHGMASVCSGLVSAILGTPADVVKTRFMNQPTENGRGSLYKSSIDCLVKTVRSEGFYALYKGFIPIWARMAPWSMTFWLTYEEIRKRSGTSSF